METTSDGGPATRSPIRGISTAAAALAVAAMLVVPPVPARASALTWVERGAVGVGVVGIGLMVRRAALLVAGAVAARCVQTSCLDGIGRFLSEHPHVGRGLIDHEFRVYSRDHPADAATVAQVQAAAAALQPARPVGPDGRPMSRTQVQPPGDCEPQQQSSLQSDVEQSCKGAARACKAGDILSVLEEKIGRNRACMAARNRINETCFRGGDLNHRQALQSAIAAVTACERAIARMP